MLDFLAAASAWLVTPTHSGMTPFGVIGWLFAFALAIIASGYSRAIGRQWRRFEKRVKGYFRR